MVLFTRGRRRFRSSISEDDNFYSLSLLLVTTRAKESLIKLSFAKLLIGGLEAGAAVYFVGVLVSKCAAQVPGYRRLFWSQGLG